MARKDFIKKMADILTEKRDALRQAVTGDDSLYSSGMTNR